jgi:ferritin-like metal-binding protein YciE
VRLAAHDARPSRFKDSALRAGALNWSAFFQGQPDTPGKLAAFAYAFEHLEIAAYEQLMRVSERAGDAETVTTVKRILAEERAAARRLWGAFDRATGAALEAQGVAG